jgi:hypothetical protein
MNIPASILSDKKTIRKRRKKSRVTEKKLLNFSMIENIRIKTVESIVINGFLLNSAFLQREEPNDRRCSFMFFSLRDLWSMRIQLIPEEGIWQFTNEGYKKGN